MKARSKDFTSAVGLLMKAGHKCVKINLEKGVGSVLSARHDHVWFPGLQIIIHVDSNKIIQLRQDGEGGWFYRKGRKNAWYAIHEREGGADFIKLIAPYYTKFLNDAMIGGSDVAQPEGRSLQSGNGQQAT